MFDLAAYLTRIDLPAHPTADAAGLERMQRAHRLAIPFENFDVRLGRGIAIDSASVFAKLVTARRGGYCFEHNRLLLDALAAAGFTARPLLARVWLGLDPDAAAVPPLTHALALVSLDGGEWIADAGFGGSYIPVMPLADDAEAEAPDGARFRLTRTDDGGWMLWRDGDPATTDGRATDAGWQRQYRFDTRIAHDSDLALANWWTQSAPDSRFVRHVVASIVLPRGIATLTDRTYRRSAGGNSAAGSIDDPRVYRLRASLMFGIDLTAAEVGALGLFD